MSYIYAQAGRLPGQSKVGTGECVALVRHFTKAPHSSTWREGEKVFGNKQLKVGTAIATFERGRWPGRPTGNHAALYIGQDSTAIYVVDQWNKGDTLKKIRLRRIIKKQVKAEGSYFDPSSNALAFSVIE